MVIIESGLSRINQWIELHDCGTINAFRHEYSKEENLKRNQSLKAKLLAKGYGITIVDGSYIENYGKSDAVEVKEQIFFVVDLKDSKELLDDLLKFGEYFDQDSIIYIPVGEDQYILYGTSKRDNSFPGYGKKIVYHARHMGIAGEFMTKVKGRPFVFESINNEIKAPEGYFGKMGMSAVAKQDWKDLN